MIGHASDLKLNLTMPILHMALRIQYYEKLDVLAAKRKY